MRWANWAGVEQAEPGRGDGSARRNKEVRGAALDFGRWARPDKKEKFNNFPNLFLMQKQFQKSLENVLDARKILRKFPKFRKNSQKDLVNT